MCSPGRARHSAWTEVCGGHRLGWAGWVGPGVCPGETEGMSQSEGGESAPGSGWRVRTPLGCPMCEP